MRSHTGDRELGHTAVEGQTWLSMGNVCPVCGADIILHMAYHPINLGLRFLLELAALFAVGFWGWTGHTGLARYFLTLVPPILLAALWGTFRVPGDPGKAPVAVSGPIRLLLEGAVFSLAVWALYGAGRPTWSLVLAVLVIAHYAASYDRLARLLERR